MTLNRVLVQALLLTTLGLGGCAAGGADAAEGAVDENGSESAWALVDAGKCTPDCSGRTCGLDPVCGVSCGVCATGQTCDTDVGQCQTACVPDCSGRTCGLDPICGVSCGSCSQGSSCNMDKGVCETNPPTGPSCPRGGHNGNSGGGAGGSAGGHGGSSGGPQGQPGGPKPRGWIWGWGWPWGR